MSGHDVGHPICQLGLNLALESRVQVQSQEQQQQQEQQHIQENYAQQPAGSSLEQVRFRQLAEGIAEGLSNRVPGKDGGQPCRRAEKGFYAFDNSGACTETLMREWCFETFGDAVSHGATQQHVESTLRRAQAVPSCGADGSFQRNVPSNFKSLLTVLEQFGVLPADYGTIDYDMCTQCGFIYRQVLTSTRAVFWATLLSSSRVVITCIWQQTVTNHCSCRGSNQGAQMCGRCEAVRGEKTSTRVKYRPLRRFIEHLLSSENGRAAVLKWSEEAANPSGTVCMSDGSRTQVDITV